MPTLVIMEAPKYQETWYWWSVRKDAPYLVGKDDIHFGGPFLTAEKALAHMARKRDDISTSGVKEVKVASGHPDFTETEKLYLTLSFHLPWDELTEQFTARHADCPHANALDSHLTLSFQHEDSDVKALSYKSIDTRLFCMTKVAATATSEGYAVMKVNLLVEFVRPRTLGNKELVNSLKTTVSLPPYYEEPIVGTLTE